MDSTKTGIFSAVPGLKTYIMHPYFSKKTQNISHYFPSEATHPLKKTQNSAPVRPAKTTKDAVMGFDIGIGQQH